MTNGFTIWLTGLSGSGKTTISDALTKKFEKLGINYFCLDGDTLRMGLNNDLGYTEEDRNENIRRAGEVSLLLAQNGNVVICSFISPYETGRLNAKKAHTEKGVPFIEVYLSTSLEVCEQRDVKNLYKRARAGEIKNFTGIDSPYEKPLNPEIVMDTSALTLKHSIKSIISYLFNNGLITTDKKIHVKELFATPEAGLNLSQEVTVELTEIDLQWVQVLSEGWASPLSGFMRESEYLQCIHFRQIKINGQLHCFGIPIVLPIDTLKKDEINEKCKTKVFLLFKGELIGCLDKIEVFPHRKSERASKVYGIDSVNHPAIKKIYESGDWLIGGNLATYKKVTWNDGLDEYRKTPRELKRMFKERNADAVFAFQLRNPIHNGHALLMKNTRQKLIDRGFKNPMLLLHPLGGWTKDDDVPLSFRIKQHQAVIEENILEKNSTILSIFPSPMSYAGPSEVIWHCRGRLSSGVKFYIVGRDPAGLPHPEIPKTDLYDHTHGSKVLRLAPGLPAVEIIPFEVAAYNTKNSRMEIFDPQRKDEFRFISGTEMRRLAREKQSLPPGFMCESGWKILQDYYNSKQ